MLTLDDVQLRLINDGPIRFLLFTEGCSNLFFLLILYIYPSAFLTFLLQPDDQINSLTTHLLFWWTSWLFVLTGLMFAAIPSVYNTPTLTAGLIHVRRYLYWALLFSELFLAFHLIQTVHRTMISIGFSVFLLSVVIGRLIVLFPKQHWFGTILIENITGENF